MHWLILGVALWSGVHVIPSLGQSLRSRLINNFGAASYKIGFSVALVVSIVLMVIGWRATDPVTIYQLPGWGGPVTTLLMIVVFLLFGAAMQPTKIKQYVRHPQLTGLFVWAIAHLISNGDSRSLILFGGLGLWALIEMSLINAREGEWAKPNAPSIGAELKGAAISLAIFAVALLLHPYFAGVSAIPR